MSLYCPDCRKKIDVPEKASGKLTCPACQTEFAVPKTRAKDVLPPGTRIKGYEIVKPIGSGGMGNVYEALQLSLHRKVAMKILSSQVAGSDAMAKRFLLEVRATASLEHPNIVTVFEANQHEGMLFLAMELIDGVSLDRLLKELKGPMDEYQALGYAAKIADAMNYAWRHQQLLHRDIKPANIILDNNGQIKLCDLGIAKRPNDDFDLTQEGMAIGTPHYMSPEQGKGLLDLDFRCDIYALGASLYHLCTGTLPYDDKSAVAVISKHIVEELPDPTERYEKLSAPCAQLITRMMHKDREERHDSWDSLLKDIQRVIDGKFPVSRTTGETSEVEVPEIVNEDEEPEIVEEPTEDAAREPRLIKGKSTLVDIDAIQREIRRTELTRRLSEQGWSIVRMAMLLLILFVTTNAVVYQYRKELLPEFFVKRHNPVQQPLILDDGTPPHPTESGVATREPPLLPTPRLDFAAMLLKAEGNPDNMFKFFDTLQEEGQTPIQYARKRRRRDQHAVADSICQFILEHPQYQAGRWAAPALEDLVQTAEKRKKESDVQKYLRKGIAAAPKCPPEVGAIAYFKMTDHYFRQKSGSQANQLLINGIKLNLKANLQLAEILAVRLIRGYDHTTNHPALWKWSKFILKHFPTSSAATAVAEELVSKLPALPQFELPFVEEDQEVLYQLRPYLVQLSADRREIKAAALLAILDHYLKLNQPKKIDQLASHILEKFGDIQTGRLGGLLLMKLGDAAKTAGHTDAWVEHMERLVRERYWGTTQDDLAVQATKALIKHYEEVGNDAQHDIMTQRLIYCFPGTKGDLAGETLLALAVEDLKGRKFNRGFRRLHKIVNDYPGENDRRKKQALSYLRELGKKRYLEVNQAMVEFESYGPFMHFLEFSPKRLTSITTPKNSDQTPTSITIECWIRQPQRPAEVQTILSRMDDKGTGFSLINRADSLAIQFDSETGSGMLAIPNTTFDWWRHLAIIVSDTGIQAYVDGKLAAEDKQARPALPAGLPVSIGTGTSKSAKQFTGTLQHVGVFNRVQYEKDFFPKPTPHHLHEAAAFISATQVGPLDLCGGEPVIGGK